MSLPISSTSSGLGGTPASFSSLLLCITRNRTLFSPLLVCAFYKVVVRQRPESTEVRKKSRFFRKVPVRPTSTRQIGEPSGQEAQLGFLLGQLERPSVGDPGRCH